MYRVVKSFTDCYDGDHFYSKGDLFPRKGVTATGERIKALEEMGLVQAVKRQKEEKTK